MIQRLITCALGLAIALMALFFLHLAASPAKGANFDKDWLLEDLTCKELISGYNFEIVVMNDIMLAYDNCRHYADSPADSGFGDLHCALLKKEGEFVEGMINAIVGVFDAKRCDGIDR